MSLDLTTAALPEPVIPDDLAVRPFRPGADDAAWLAANAATFADHPEQGRWRQSDLDARIGEPWFDPAGFHLVVPTSAPDTVAAYHWTKRTSATDGEVYVVGIHPTHQGRGLGSSVTLLGLRHLRDVGVRVAHLYVDGGNARALATYTRLGFVVIATDRMYSWV
jgi:mycothiol synthase